MLSKLKGQLEEMRSKVQFLGLAKKYLQARPPPLPPEAPPSKPSETHPPLSGCPRSGTG